jgi:hypothetical protein
MVQQNNRDMSSPYSIELLFNNEKLEFMKTLCLMYVFLAQSKKRRKISEIIFYYSLGEQVQKIPSHNLYFRFSNKINTIILKMSHLKFVSVQGDLMKKFDDITVQITPLGKEFFEDIRTDYFINLEKRYINMLNEIKFSSHNMRIIKGEEK